MTIGPDDYCCGEFPPIDDSVLRSGGQMKEYGPRPRISTASPIPGVDALIAENAKLRSDLAAALQARDTAQAQNAHYRTYYSRSGW